MNLLNSNAITLIVGGNGQDGKILKKILSESNRQIYIQNRNGIYDSLNNKISEVDASSFVNFFSHYKPILIFFLAAHHSPAGSESNNGEIKNWQKQFDVNLHLLSLILEAIRQKSPKSRLFYASSALVFGEPQQIPQSEATPQDPIESYGLSKKMGQELVTYYRVRHSLFAVTGILYPHESHLRQDNYLFKQILNAAISNSRGHESVLQISNPSFTREWNSAFQVMECASQLLLVSEPSDYVIGSGVQNTVLEVCKEAFGYFGLNTEEYISVKEKVMIVRSPNLRANPEKLIETIGHAPDMTLQNLIEDAIKGIRT